MSAVMEKIKAAAEEKTGRLIRGEKIMVYERAGDFSHGKPARFIEYSSGGNETRVKISYDNAGLAVVPRALVERV